MEFPIDVSATQDLEDENAEHEMLMSSGSGKHGDDDNDDDDGEDVIATGSGGRKGGSLLPRPRKASSSEVHVTVCVERIGLKDAPIYVKPRIVVSLVNGSGRLVEKQQELPISTKRENKHIVFGQSVYLQTPLEKFGADYSLFFEFKHFKEDKKKLSTRCFSFMERDEMKPDELIALEL